MFKFKLEEPKILQSIYCTFYSCFIYYPACCNVWCKTVKSSIVVYTQMEDAVVKCTLLKTSLRRLID